MPQLVRDSFADARATGLGFELGHAKLIGEKSGPDQAKAALSTDEEKRVVWNDPFDGRTDGGALGASAQESSSELTAPQQASWRCHTQPTIALPARRPAALPGLIRQKSLTPACLLTEAEQSDQSEARHRCAAAISQLATRWLAERPVVPAAWERVTRRASIHRPWRAALMAAITAARWASSPRERTRAAGLGLEASFACGSEELA